MGAVLVFTVDKLHKKRESFQKKESGEWAVFHEILNQKMSEFSLSVSPLAAWLKVLDLNHHGRQREHSMRK